MFMISNFFYYIIYGGANILYVQTMLQTLPYNDLKQNKDISLREIVNSPDDGPVGFIVEVYI